ncbi:MAG: DUF975 family protein [Lactobacillus sp.]|jgi:uncharacterized membrane protein|uniref:DUF975 family protein n=1 Tax=Lacticaseibacillus suilingensis TaxID=2799577 RepID=A0ABW4BBP7_9LACO|nr:DUF975 family protein [Lacticaseibacillus suilingensis]MCI1894504.1 DUF975 family protein [Lactobacillus sp.]MCI1916963.1 DUF975 family protein [Lactobacillus sp.]MCI1941179.1 DUF975 family protein [Lactobacillus sp.]MCI1971723.1 DUF975 family protein [Lactobacillus sp.]MCI2016338.1 DUF975 family protein [Lactobacillus sp.]
MENQYQSRRQIKRRAKAILRQPGMYKQLMLANLLPWLISVAFAFLAVYTVMQVMLAFGLENVANNPNNFIDYYQGNTAVEQQTMLKSLIMLWFSQSITFTALDLMRQPDQTLSGWQVIFRTFNSRFFFGILAVYIYTVVFISLGLAAFVIPGIMLMFGLHVAYYVYYDGKTHPDGRYFSALTAVGRAWRMMRGHKFDYFVLQLTLIGWSLLETLTMHVFDVFIQPYLQLVDAGFYATVRQQYDDEQAMLKDENM